MTALIIVIAALPLLGAAAGLAGLRARTCGYVAVSAAVPQTALAVWLLLHTLSVGHFESLGGFVYVDDLSGYFLFVITLVILAASLGSAAYVHVEEQRRDLTALQVMLYFAAFGVFASMMSASVLTGNLGLLFVLIEASTLASVVLVGLEASAASLEAAWKYVIISSLGVTIALVGTLYLFYAGTHLQVSAGERLTWPYLFAHAGQLTHPALRLAFLLAVIGYGTKVGLAPMHTWLPDAHAEAPSPASAMLSAALLNTGMYAIIRFLTIARVGLGEAYVGHVMLLFGFLSLAVGAVFLTRPGNVKRLFAYSSVEHMGIIAIGLGFGGLLGFYGALLHVLNHSIGKTVLFLVSGDLVLAYRTKQSRQIRGVLLGLPLTGGVLLVATMAIVGSPPFGLFISELTVLRAGFDGGYVLPALMLLLLAIAFIGLSRTVTHMVTGPSDRPVAAYVSRADRWLAAIPLVVGLVALVVLGLWVPALVDAPIMHTFKELT